MLGPFGDLVKKALSLEFCVTDAAAPLYMAFVITTVVAAIYHALLVFLMRRIDARCFQERAPFYEHIRLDDILANGRTRARAH